MTSLFPLLVSGSVHSSSAAQASALVTLPEATTPKAFMKWASSLPTSNPPTWLGLAPNAEAAVLASRGEQLLSNWQVGAFGTVPQYKSTLLWLCMIVREEDTRR